MLRKGFLTYQQALAESSRNENLGIAYDKISEEMRVLEGVNKQRTQTEFEAKLLEARRALNRTRNQAVSKKLQTDIAVWAKKSILDHEEKRLNDLEDQLHYCTITAPQDGIVVYFNSFQARSWSGSQQAIIAQGEPVREGQRLMRIPSLSKMVVNTYVHEAALTHVHADARRPTHFGDVYKAGLLAGPSILPGLVGRQAFDAVHDDFDQCENEVLSPGDQAEVHLHAFPGRVLHGHVHHISSAPSQLDWALVDVKLYPTTITIEDSVEDLKPGLTADVTMFGEKPLEQVLAMPLEAVVKPEQSGQPAHCFVLTPQGPVEREVVVGMQSQSLVQIRSGVEEGEEVILNPLTVLQEKNPSMNSASGETGIH
jgi:HlyD family secretion protein